MYFSLLLSKQEQSHLFQFPYIPLCKGFFINTFALEAFNLDTADGKQRENVCILPSVGCAYSFLLQLVEQHNLCFCFIVNYKKYSFQHITS